MAAPVLRPFTSTDSILTKDAASHIMERHCTHNPDVPNSYFCPTFNLQQALHDVGDYTWETTPNATLLDEGFKQGHGHFRLFVFNLHETIGWDRNGFSTTQLAVYYSERVPGEKWSIITTYPWTMASYYYYCVRNNKPHQLQL